MKLTKGCLIFLFLLALVLSERLPGWQLFVGFFLVIYLTIDVLNMIWVAAYRKKIIGYIAEHKAEIQTAA